MAMHSSENILDFFGHLNNVNCIILYAYKSYTLLPSEPALDAHGNISLAEMRAHYTARDENLGQFYLLNHFWAVLPVDLCRVINLQLMPTLDLDTAVRLATIELSSKEEARSTPRVHAVQPKEEDEGHKGSPKTRPTVHRGSSNNHSKTDQPRIVKTFAIKITTKATKTNHPGDPTTPATTPTRTI
jgi:hypothetical protein